LVGAEVEPATADAAGAGLDRGGAADLREGLSSSSSAPSFSTTQTARDQPRLVELLVDSLRQLGSADGDAVADEVASLARAGIRIDLRLSAPELGALADAITRTNTPARPLDPTFARLLAHLRARQAE
jgi:hypothetical protein